MKSSNLIGPNILEALAVLKKTPAFSVKQGSNGNSIQLVGSGLESFTKDLFANTLGTKLTKLQKKSAYSRTFSYAGNANNPPDIILKNGDAIEVKKADSLTAGIQLNSSPPKAKLLATDTRINQACRQLALDEGWVQKDIIYLIGSLDSKNILKRIWFVYGDCFAAQHEVYEKIAQRVTGAISQSFEETELAQTNELAGVPNVDPLNITHLRVRGMWIIKNPSIIFEDITPISNANSTFRVYCLMLETKYYSFPDDVRARFESSLDDKMVMHKVKISNPDNPVKLMEARLITYEI